MSSRFLTILYSDGDPVEIPIEDVPALSDFCNESLVDDPVNAFTVPWNFTTIGTSLTESDDS
jgi:hypothetical protein